MHIPCHPEKEGIILYIHMFIEAENISAMARNKRGKFRNKSPPVGAGEEEDCGKGDIVHSYEGINYNTKIIILNGHDRRLKDI